MPRKLNADASASMKILGLFCLLLFSGRKFSLSELAAHFRCSKQTILRLIDQITVSENLPLRIQCEREGKRNLYWASSNHRPLNVCLRPESIQQLLVCKDLVCHLIPQAFRDEISRAIEQATVLLPNFEDREMVLTSYAGGIPKGQIDYSAHQEMIKALFKAIQKKKICEAVYHAPKYAEAKQYCFVPLRIVAYRDALYLRSQSYPGGQAKTFAIHRFKSLNVSDRGADIPPLVEKPGEKVFGFMAGEPFKLTVEFFPPVAGYVAERTWSANQQLEKKKNGNVVLTFSATNQTEVIAWLLSFGKHAKILAPEPVKKEYLKQILEIKAQYR